MNSDRITRFLSFIERRFLPRPLSERDSLAYWREMIVFAILLSGVVGATLIMIPSIHLTLQEKARGMTILNFAGYLGGIVLLFYRRPPFEVRALYVLLMNYLIGLGVMLNFGPMSGGPSWLFAFAVLSGVLMGVRGAFIALGINAATLSIYGWIFGTGLVAPSFPFFTSLNRGLTGVANFLMVNTMAAVAVAALVKGLVAAQNKEKQLLSNLEREHTQLCQVTEELKTEVQERVRAEAHLKDALSEKEILLKEIHHRVKNNLQIVNSLLSLQTRQIEDESVNEVYRATMSRVQAMAIVHENLYRSQNVAEIDFRRYLSDLAEHCTCLFPSANRNVSIEVQSEDIAMTIDQATPCGLIVNELVTNALKYAFPNDKPGRVLISARLADTGEMAVEVRDNGVGIPEEVDWRQTGSLGLNLVRILSEGQLQGKVEMLGDNGSVFRIRFRRKL